MFALPFGERKAGSRSSWIAEWSLLKAFRVMNGSLKVESRIRKEEFWILSMLSTSGGPLELALVEVPVVRRAPWGRGSLGGAAERRPERDVLA